MNDNLCYNAWNCRNRKIMCAFCKFQDKYIPKLNQTVANTIRKSKKFKEVAEDN